MGLEFLTFILIMAAMGSFLLNVAIIFLLLQILENQQNETTNPAVPVSIILYVDGQEIEEPMQLKINDSLPFTIQAADEAGNPTAASFDSPPAWSISDTSVGTVTPSADGLSATVTSPSGKLASATVQVSGLVGGVSVLGSAQIDFVAGDVAEIVLVPGTPVAVAPATPAPAQS